MRPIVAVPGAPQPLSIERSTSSGSSTATPFDQAICTSARRGEVPLVVVFGVDPERVRLHVVDKVLQVVLAINPRHGVPSPGSASWTPIPSTCPTS